MKFVAGCGLSQEDSRWLSSSRLQPRDSHIVRSKVPSKVNVSGIRNPITTDCGTV